MSTNTPTQQPNTPESTNSTASDGSMVEGITHLPGYEALQQRIGSSLSAEELTKDTLFDILRNQRRRYVLQYLETHSEGVRLGELSDVLAGWELHPDDVCVTHRDRKRVYVALYQSHLPKLDDAGAIAYDKARGTIELGPNYQYFREYLQSSHTGPLLWHRLYLGGGLLSIGIVGLAQVTAFPFVAVPEIIWFALVFGIFGALLFAHWFAERSF